VIGNVAQVARAPALSRFPPERRPAAALAPLITNRRIARWSISCTRACHSAALARARQGCNGSVNLQGCAAQPMQTCRECSPAARPQLCSCCSLS
jgi:hypothetical protein